MGSPDAPVPTSAEFGGFSSCHHVHKMRGLVDDGFRSLSGKAPRQPDARLIAFSQAERISIRSTLVCEESRAGGAGTGSRWVSSDSSSRFRSPEQCRGSVPRIQFPFILSHNFFVGLSRREKILWVRVRWVLSSMHLQSIDHAAWVRKKNSLTK